MAHHWLVDNRDSGSEASEPVGLCIRSESRYTRIRQ